MLNAGAMEGDPFAELDQLIGIAGGPEGAADAFGELEAMVRGGAEPEPEPPELQATAPVGAADKLGSQLDGLTAHASDLTSRVAQFKQRQARRSRQPERRRRNFEV